MSDHNVNFTKKFGEGYTPPKTLSKLSKGTPFPDPIYLGAFGTSFLSAFGASHSTPSPNLNPISAPVSVLHIVKI